jgi:predicted nucleic acid-binding protein
VNREFVDTNVFLRYLTADHPSKYKRCRELFRRAVTGEVILVTSGMVIAELIWTLQSYYKVAKPDIVEKVSIIVALENLEISDKSVIGDALVLFGRKEIDYIDAYNAVLMRREGIDGILSYDTDFDLIEDIKRREP